MRIEESVQRDVALIQKENGCSYHEAWMIAKSLNPNLYTELEQGGDASGTGLENADTTGENATQRDVRESIPAWGWKAVGLAAGASLPAFADALGRARLDERRLSTLRINILTEFERRQPKVDRLSSWTALKSLIPALFADGSPVQFGSYRSYGVDSNGVALANAMSAADSITAGRFFQTFLPDEIKTVLALKGEETDGMIMQRLRVNSLKLTEDQARTAINGMLAGLKGQGLDADTALDLVNRHAYALFRFARLSDPAWEPGLAQAPLENARRRSLGLANIRDKGEL